MNNEQRIGALRKKHLALTHSPTTAYADAVSAAERALNDGILGTDISSGYDEFLTIVDEFYSDTIEVRSAASLEPIIGKVALKSALLRYLIPLQLMAETGDVSVCLQVAPLAGDSREDRHSRWWLELVDPTDRRVQVSWTVLRRWKRSRVVDEYHYDYHHEGEPLLLPDVGVAPPNQLE